VNAERAAASRAFDDAIARLEAALAKIEAALTAPPPSEEAAHLSTLEQRARGASPLLGRQRSFNTAVLNELKHQRTIQRAVIELIRSQAALVEFLRTIKPYVDTRDFADVLRAMAEEDLKRADALLARDRRRELQLADIDAELTAIRTRLDELQRSLAS
jgi:DNA repair exonuclease SbcCD ATPase subunit